jgi:hypothetical protein
MSVQRKLGVSNTVCQSKAEGAGTAIGPKTFERPSKFGFETLAGRGCSQSGIRRGRLGYIRRSELWLEANQTGVAQGSFPPFLRRIGEARREPTGEAVGLALRSVR